MPLDARSPRFFPRPLRQAQRGRNREVGQGDRGGRHQGEVVRANRDPDIVRPVGSNLARCHQVVFRALFRSLGKGMQTQAGDVPPAAGTTIRRRQPPEKNNEEHLLEVRLRFE